MKEETVDLINYFCAECNGEDWNLKIGHHQDGRTFLYVMCASPECQKAQRIKYNIDNDDLPLVWDELDITGQGHDPQDMVGVIPKEHLN
jgi:hypothetical protein